MTITTPCRQCRHPVTVTLDDTTRDTEAEAIASRLYCLRCAIDRMTQHTAGHEGSEAGTGEEKHIGDPLFK